MSETISKDALPTSFGAFNPIGHVMLGLPGGENGLIAALHEAGWDDDAVLRFTPRESVAEFEAMVENASGAAGFGTEIGLMRRYLDFAREGYQWVLVAVDGVEEAAQAAEIARAHGAKLAVHYRLLVTEELI